MEKLKNATKRIAAVATSVVMLSSAASAAGLGDYPNNFVQDGKFNGQIVVGSTAAAIDSTSAATIVEDLKTEFSGESEKVTISYKDGSTDGGEEVKILDSGEMHLLGQNLGDNKNIAFDDRDLDVLEDSSVKLAGSTSDYSQSVKIGDNGYFEHSLRDRLESDISQKLFFERDDVIMSYTLDMDSSVNTIDFEDSDVIGQKMTIMGNQFTVGGYRLDGTGNFDELKLLGGANTISLGEGETTTVTLDGKSYEVTIQSVAVGSTSNKVLLSINGESKSIDEFDSELVGGVTVAVTDLVPSSRDAVKGYAEIVIGGQEVVLKHNQEVEVNDEDISDLFEDYEVTAYFNLDGSTGTGLATDEFDGFTLEYKHTESNGLILRDGDVWEDNVFNAVGIKFDGTNQPDYEVTELVVSGDDLRLSGTTITGDDFNRDIAYGFVYDNAGTDEAAIRLIGDRDYVPMLVEDVAFTVTANGTAAAAADFVVKGLSVEDPITLPLTTGEHYSVANDSQILFSGTAAEISDVFELAVNTGAGDTAPYIQVNGFDADFSSGMIIFAGDEDNQYLYEVTNYKQDTNPDDSTFSFEDLLSGKTTTDVKHGNVATKLVDVDTFTADGENTITAIVAARSTIESGLAFENQLMVDLSAVNAVDVSTTGAGASAISFKYDEGDMTLDSNADANDFDVTLEYHIGDEEIRLGVDSVGAGWEEFTGAKTDVSTSNSDVKQVVDAYGTIVEYDTDSYDSVIVSVPDEQLEAKVYLVAGDVSTSTMTKTVDADMVDEVKAELEADGYTITGTETVTAEAVEFDVTSAVVDTEVSGTSDMIVVGGPAVNAVARALMGIETYTIDQAGVEEGKGIVRYFEDVNSVLVYGYAGEDTLAAVNKLNEGALAGTSVNVN